MTQRDERCLTAEVFLNLQYRPLDAGECIVATLGDGVERVTLLPHPDCTRCTRKPRPDSETSARSFRRALNRTRAHDLHADVHDALCNSRVGPIERDELEGKPGVYPLDLPFVWGSVFLSRKTHNGVHALSTYGGIYGSGTDVDTCRLVAVSEGVERLATRAVSPDIWTSAHAHPDAVPLRSLYSWATDDDERKSRGFCWGYDLVSKRPRLVPLESVAVGWPRALYPETCHVEAFYSGAASHRTLAQAIANATIELIQRDAWMISWYRKRAIPRLSWPKSMDAVATARTEYLRAHGLRLELFDLRLDFPLPTVLLRLTATRARGNWPKGGSMLIPGAGLTRDAALNHVLGYSCAQYVSNAVQAASFKDPLNPNAVKKLGKTSEFWPLLARYLNPASRKSHAFLGSDEIAFEDLPEFRAETPQEAIAVMGRWFAERQLPWLAVRLTDDVTARAGFETVKVVVPGFVMIAPSRRRTNLGLSRMNADWPHATLRGLNRDPHPLC